MASLNASDFGVVRGDAEHRRLAVAAQISEVVHIAVQDDPTDSRGNRGFGHLGQSGADGFEDDSIGTCSRGRLDGLQQLLALINGVVVRVNDLDLDTDPLGGFLG